MKTHRKRLTVDWAHCDAAGIVFYPHFYIWFDQATERLFSANGLSYGEMERDFGVSGMPLLETGASYKAPCKLGMEIEIESEVTEWAGRTFRVDHKIFHTDGTLALEGFERRAWVVAAPDTPKGMKAIPVPTAAMERFRD